MPLLSTLRELLAALLSWTCCQHSHSIISPTSYYIPATRGPSRKYAACLQSPSYFPEFQLLFLLMFCISFEFSAPLFFFSLSPIWPFIFTVQSWNLWVFSGIPSLRHLMVDFFSFIHTPLALTWLCSPVHQEVESLSVPLNLSWPCALLCPDECMEETLCRFSLSASSIPSGFNFRFLSETHSANGKSLGPACRKMKGPMDQRWVTSAFPAEDMGQGREGIFDYLLLLHIFSQFSCFWPECTPSFRSTWGLSILSLAASLQEEHYCLWAPLHPAEVSVSSSQLTYPSFTPFLLSKCYCCILSSSLCPQFYCLLLNYCKV